MRAAAVAAALFADDDLPFELLAAEEASFAEEESPAVVLRRVFVVVVLPLDPLPPFPVPDTLPPLTEPTPDPLVELKSLSSSSSGNSIVGLIIEKPLFPTLLTLLLPRPKKWPDDVNGEDKEVEAVL